MRIEEVLNEVSILSQDFSDALEDSDVIRVYHGSDDTDFIYVALTKGVSGDVIAKRRFSYEANNNPKGMFVTPDLRVAKEFGSYILEFHTRIRDLEAPVWPGGTWTAPGQMSGIFNSDDEREQERLAQRMNWSESEFEFVKNSDRPELAATLLKSGERQALYRGDLNKNSIRAVWVSRDPSKVQQPFDRISPREFVERIEQGDIPSKFGSPAKVDTQSDVYRDAKKKLVEPREDVSFDLVVDRIADERRNMGRDEIANLARKNPEGILRKVVWSDRQYDQILRTM